MDSDLQQMVDSEQLPADLVPKLEKLTPGTCCQHRSWGTGKIREWDKVLNRIVIDFQTKAGHQMEFKYAADSLIPLPDDHIEAVKLNDPAGARELAAKDPLALMKIVVRSLQNFATAPRIEETLCPSVIPVADWKKWWEGAKRVMKKNPHFSVPGKRSEPILLHDAPPDHKQDALASIAQAIGPKAKLLALEELLKHSRDLDAPTVEQIVADIDATIAKTPSSQQVAAVELALARDELIEETTLKGKFDAASVSKFIPRDPRPFVNLAESLSASKQSRYVLRVSVILGERWHKFATDILPYANGRIAEVVIESYKKNGRLEEVLGAVERLVRERKLHYDFLIWICKNRRKEFQPLINVQLFYAILSVLELDTLEGSRKSGRLQDLLISNKDLIRDLLEGAREDEVRDVTRAIMLSPIFDELDKRSVLATLVKLYPFIQVMIIGGENKSENISFVVSWDSLAKRKTELEEIITKKIPENSRDIAVARSYGDLRENSEFKAAKEMQSVLMRRRAELESMLLRAQGTDFKGADTSAVNIGTIVDLVDLNAGEKLCYTILGAWDSEPEKGIISYLTPVAQGLHKKAVGDTADVTFDNGETRKVRIEAIRAYNP
ncbi:MAG: GreA/GreB family elongation factor [Methylacidiphilales bacterium]|nr:GreA/GreB family elongation factor [Candidatus Methylacidiphilales bacterium]